MLRYAANEKLADGIQKREFPRPRTIVPELEQIVESWALSAPLQVRDWPLHIWDNPAINSDIDAAEQALGRCLPPTMRALYEMSSGIYLFQGYLCFDQLLPSDPRISSLIDHSQDMREYSDVPDELVIFGHNGGDELFGIWIPRGAKEDAPMPVIMAADIFDPKSLSVAGINFHDFLLRWTLFFTLELLDEGVNQQALDVLLPEELRSSNHDAEWYKNHDWGLPELPFSHPSPYAGQFNVDQLRELYGRSI